MEARLKVLRSEYGMTTEEQVQSVVLSILSDAQEELSLGHNDAANDKINFAKYLMLKAWQAWLYVVL